MDFLNIFGLLWILTLVTENVSGQVLELDDSFSEKKQDQAWLVKFYAPWCGHCRKLEPTYHQVYLELKNSKIKVAKVDATRFSRIGSEYDVRGYPTIKFIHGDRVFTHNGERSKEGIVEFAKRAYGPQVRQLTSVGRLSEAKVEHSSGVFFLYIGPLLDGGKLYEVYQSLAQKYAVRSYFYAAERKVMPSDLVSTGGLPSIVVIKDGTHLEFDVPVEEDQIEGSLNRWINAERFAAFPKIGGVGLNEMSDLGKMLVIFVLDDKETSDVQQSRYKDIAIQLSFNLSRNYKSHYQMVCMTDVDAASNIVMSSVDSPYLFVLDPHNHQFYIPDFVSHLSDVTIDNVTQFLDDISDRKIQAYGGTGIVQRFQRLFYDIWSTIYGIYHESPWLALMVFGIPTFVISIICYTLCCLEPADEDELNRSSDDEDDDMIDVDRSQEYENSELTADDSALSNHAKSE